MLAPVIFVVCFGALCVCVAGTVLARWAEEENTLRRRADTLEQVGTKCWQHDRLSQRLLHSWCVEVCVSVICKNSGRRAGSMILSQRLSEYGLAISQAFIRDDILKTYGKTKK